MDLFLTGDPRVDAFLDCPEGDEAIMQHSVMKAADIELRAEGVLGALSLDQECLHPHHEGGGLTRDRDVAIDFTRGVGARRVVIEILDRLFARPMLVMNAGVDHEPAGAPEFGAPVALCVGDHLLVSAFSQLSGIRKQETYLQRLRFLIKCSKSIVFSFAFTSVSDSDVRKNFVSFQKEILPYLVKAAVTI